MPERAGTAGAAPPRTGAAPVSPPPRGRGGGGALEGVLLSSAALMVETELAGRCCRLNSGASCNGLFCGLTAVGLGRVEFTTSGPTQR